MSGEQCRRDMESERSLCGAEDGECDGDTDAEVGGLEGTAGAGAGAGAALDDERTLEEEEALAAADPTHDPRAELSELRAEGELPLHELLALYGCPAPPPLAPTPASAPALAPPTLPAQAPALQPAAASKSRLRVLYEDEPPRLRSAASDEEDDCDYSPDEEDWKKTIMVGSDYQAQIPDGLCSYDDALPYENEDKLVWNPSPLSEDEVVRYLGECAGAGGGGGGAGARDDEQALYLLQACAHSVEEALRRRRVAPPPQPALPPAPPLPPPAPAPPHCQPIWSEEECRNFENGLKAHGKDFHLIRQNKVRTRSVGELVQFYYTWKKTERHDIFANKARLDKKKYTLHPGHTDYMDRFLEEQEAEAGVMVSSAGPGAAAAGGPAAPAGDPLALGEHEVFAHLPSQ